MKTINVKFYKCKRRSESIRVVVVVVTISSQDLEVNQFGLRPLITPLLPLQFPSHERLGPTIAPVKSPVTSRVPRRKPRSVCELDEQK